MGPGGDATRAGGHPGRGAATFDGPDWVLPRADVARWVARAKAGERLIYAHGQQLVRGETSLFVRELAMADRVNLFQPKAGPGCFSFMIEKKDGPAPRLPAMKDDGAEALDQVRRILTREANFGRRASSNAELAKAVGLERATQAAWLVQKLLRAGAIKVEVVTGGPDANWRIVTITATGKSTQAPPSWERAKAQVRQETVHDR